MHWVSIGYAEDPEALIKSWRGKEKQKTEALISDQLLESTEGNKKEEN